MSSAGPAAPDPSRLHPVSLGGLPRWVWVAAVIVGLVRMAPWAVAALRTPEGWTFTANLTVSPDYMQYRTWARQTQVEGPIVSDRFTAEPNSPHIPVPLYWAIGQVASLTGMTPEWVYAWLGLPVAMVLVLLLYALARSFLDQPRAIPWAVGFLLVGGGLGAVLLFIRDTALAEWHPFYVLVVEPLSGPTRAVPFEGYRGNYVVTSLIDTHFLVYWVVALVAVSALVNAVRWYTPRRLWWTVALFVIATVLHVYEGITLMAIAIGVVAAAIARGLPWRRGATIVLSTGMAVALCLAAVLWLHQRSGLPTPSWRGLTLPPVIVLLAFPVTWLLMAIGGGRHWREGGRDAAVLWGWAGGCLALVLSGPFFPYPDRGTLTLQVPMVLIAAAIYFRDRVTVRPAHLALLVLLAGATPAFVAWRISRATFDPAHAHTWINPEHETVIAAARTARPDDVLVADEVSLRWLGPEYPGRHHAGHFFLTVDYERKYAAMEAFYRDADPAARLGFLRDAGATLFFVPEWLDADDFAALPGVRARASSAVGTLFAVDRDAASGDRAGE